ncbi:hypothetical protein U6X16_09155 [Bacillus velezensis]|uniref:hypothetical protein n=1 Tax=Bacillus velezensis TaxID=492670 RepID=UPI002ADE3D80|nr:hypothetical protein [Bacillus velezensis]MEA1005876.1 hypothetical protein [Bacillus velezensis]
METGTGVDKVKPALSLDESDEFDLPEVDQKRRQSGGDIIERKMLRRKKQWFGTCCFVCRRRAF